jgi:hypothetical protein
LGLYKAWHALETQPPAQFCRSRSAVDGHILDEHLADDRTGGDVHRDKPKEVIVEGEQGDVRDAIAPKCSTGAESQEEGKEPRAGGIRVRAGGGAGDDSRGRRGELGADEYEARERALGLGGEEELDLPGAGGEDPVAVPAGRDEHRRRPRGGRRRRRGEKGVEDGHAEELPVLARVAVRVRGVVEERVGEGEGDEAGGLDLLQPLQLRAHRHRTQPLRLPPASSHDSRGIGGGA